MNHGTIILLLLSLSRAAESSDAALITSDRLSPSGLRPDAQLGGGSLGITG
jgi:hypothetical protein